MGESFPSLFVPPQNTTTTTSRKQFSELEKFSDPFAKAGCLIYLDGDSCCHGCKNSTKKIKVSFLLGDEN